MTFTFKKRMHLPGGLRTICKFAWLPIKTTVFHNETRTYFTTVKWLEKYTLLQEFHTYWDHSEWVNIKFVEN